MTVMIMDLSVCIKLTSHKTPIKGQNVNFKSKNEIK